MDTMDRSGFSLVELSIVLVILGLLTGGVLTGQSLIRAAELRGINKGFEEIKSASLIFKDKYFSIPGDMPNAIDFWGAADPNPVTCLTTATVGKETCNGDGDGFLNPDGREAARSWTHLKNADLISGSYSGLYGGGALVDFTNIMKSSISGTGYLPISSYYERHDYFFGRPVAVGVADYLGGAISQDEAWNIDKKVDDGLPNSGTIRANDDDGNCTDSNVYDFTISTLSKESCGLVYVNMF